MDYNKYNFSIDSIYNRNNNQVKYQEFLLVEVETLVKSNLIKSISKTQMRNIFDLIKNCKDYEELRMIKPKLLYTAGRLSGTGKNYLFDLSRAVMEARSDTDVEKMHKYIETILAYHKYYASK